MKFKIAILLLLFPIFLHASDFDIDKYNVNIRVQADGVLDITETIDVDFDSPRRGIFRNIPYRYNMTNIDGEDMKRPLFIGNKYTILIYDIKVPGNPRKITRDANNIKIRIGSRRKYISDEKQYVIKYKVAGAIKQFSNHSELYWNIIGTQWDTYIWKSNFKIKLPETISLVKNDYFAVSGKEGSTISNVSIAFEDKTLTGTNRSSLYEYEGVTVGIKLPADYFKPARFGLVLRQMLVHYTPVARAIRLPIVAFAILFILWLFVGKDDKITKMVEYLPPKGITSAEAGKIIDGKTDNRDLLSLIYYWANKGYIGIEPCEDGDFILTRKHKLIDAKQYEHYIFDRIFRRIDEKKKFSISGLRGKLWYAMENARKNLDTAWDNDKHYEPTSLAIRKVMDFLFKPGIIFLIFYMGFMLLFMGIIVNFGLNDMWKLYWLMMLIFTPFVAILSFKNECTWILGVTIGLLPLFLFIALGVKNGAGWWILGDIIGIGLIIAVIRFFRSIILKKTRVGIEKYQAVVGFKEFIERVEKDRLEKLVKKHPTYFSDILPYAVAFGLAKKWAKKFEGLMVKSPKWYKSSGKFEAISFANTIDNDIKHINKIFTYVPKSTSPKIKSYSTMSSSSSSSWKSSSTSSGFSSGGGSTGGGFGGGGGGSW